MHVAVALRHPEHVRFFRHALDELRDRGHRVSLLARAHAATTTLLDRFGLPHRVLAGDPSTPVGLVAGHARYEARLLAHAVREEVDVLASVGGRAVSHLAPLAGARSVVFLDWAPTRTDRIVARLSDTVCTPSYLAGAFGDGQIAYDGLHELSYLDPGRNGHTDGPTDRPAGPYAVLGVRDPTTAGPWYARVRDRLAAHGDVVLVSADGRDASDAVRRRCGVHAVGDAAPLLAHASVCVSALGTTATEAAVLGTPTVFAGEPPIRCRHLRDEYGLVETPDDAGATADRAAALATDGSARDRWRRRRRRLLDDADDVTDRIVTAVLGRGAHEAPERVRSGPARGSGPDPGG